MTLISGIHSDSFLAHICDHRPLLTTAGEELLRRVMLPRWDEQRGERVQSVARIISVDNGNDAFKGAMLHAQDSHLRTKRIVTAYVPARTIRAGEGVTTWQVNDSEAFQGERDLYVGLGIPNEELDLRGIREATQQALRSLLRVTWTVRRTDEQGRVTTWVLRLVEIVPYPQSFASFAAWYYTPGGTPIETDIERHVTLDIGEDLELLGIGFGLSEASA